jgi:hypothetical protein
MNCMYCDKEFDKKVQNQLYCSNECGILYRRNLLKNRKNTKCLVCNNPTHNPKFCSSSCAAVYNNHTYPKRVRTPNSCIVCGNQTDFGRKRCKNCIEQLKQTGTMSYNKERQNKECINCGEVFSGLSYSKYCSIECKKDYRKRNNKGSRNPIGIDLTLKDATYDYLHKSSMFALVRSRSRSIGKSHGLDKKCFNCGYSKHVEICHIKPVHKFTEGSLVSEINSLSNLIGLCPNCHWEFDHGMLNLER